MRDRCNSVSGCIRLETTMALAISMAIQRKIGIASLLKGVMTKMALAYEMKWTDVLCLMMSEGCFLLRTCVLPEKA